MIKRTLPLLIGLLVCGAAAAQVAPATVHSSASTSTTQTTTTVTTWAAKRPAGALNEKEIKTAIANAGYKEVKGLEFKNGVWRSKARGGNEKWVKLAVGPVNGTVYPADAPSNLNKDEVTAKLAAAGYQNVKDVEFDGGLWSADAKNAKGDDVDVLVDPNNGSVLAQSHD
ncbi:MAG: PepSY domain-containing protein [Rhodanobacter sp.]